MAKQVGVSPATVQRIWSGRGLKPHLVKTFKLSNDPLFEEKLIDVVALYLNPPENAVVPIVFASGSSLRAMRVRSRWHRCLAPMRSVIVPLTAVPEIDPRALASAPRHPRHRVTTAKSRPWRGTPSIRAGLVRGVWNPPAWRPTSSRTWGRPWSRRAGCDPATECWTWQPDRATPPSRRRWPARASWPAGTPSHAGACRRLDSAPVQLLGSHPEAEDLRARDRRNHPAHLRAARVLR